jgi:uncharacterized membrane protein
MTTFSSSSLSLRWALLLSLALASFSRTATAQEAEPTAGESAEPNAGEADAGSEASEDGEGETAEAEAEVEAEAEAEEEAGTEEPAASTQVRPLPAPPPNTAAAAVVAERVRPALAIVRCQGARWSVGFALGEPTKVVASTEARGCRRELTVESLDGERTTARSVASDGRVSILLLDEPIGLTPLEARSEAPHLGEKVYAVGVPGGANDPAVTEGAIAFADDERLQSDAPHPSGSEGGPLVDAQGRVVAVLREPADSGVSASTPIGPVAERVADTALTTEDVRQIAYPGFGLSLGILWDSGDRLLGASGLFSVDILDRIVFAVELGGYASTDDGAVTQKVRRSLILGNVSVGYRIRVAFPGGSSATLMPQIGFSFTYDRSEITTRTVGLADPTCNLAMDSCELAEMKVKTETGDWRYRPSAGLRLTLGAIEFGYETYLDTSDIGDTGHRLHVGFRF